MDKDNEKGSIVMVIIVSAILILILICIFYFFTKNFQFGEYNNQEQTDTQTPLVYIYRTDFNGSDLSGRLYRSSDGKDWEEIKNQYKGEITYAVDPKNPSIIYAGDMGGNMMADDLNIDLVKSIDGGTTWVDILQGIANEVKTENGIYGIESIFINQNDSNIIDVAVRIFNSVITFRSYDGGINWSQRTLN